MSLHNAALTHTPALPEPAGGSDAAQHGTTRHMAQCPFITVSAVTAVSQLGMCLWVSGITYLNIAYLVQNTTWEEIHWFHGLNPPGEFSPYFTLVFCILITEKQASKEKEQKTKNETKTQKPNQTKHEEYIWVEIRCGHKNGQNLDPALQLCGWWDMKEKLPMTSPIGLSGS